MLRCLAFLFPFVVSSALAGTLEVNVSPADQVRRVRVVERLPNDLMKINRRWFEAAATGEPGHYIVEDLPEKVYDICIETDEHHIEGVDLNTGANADEPIVDWWLTADVLTTENYSPEAEFEEGIVVSDEEKTQAIRDKFRLDALQKCFDTIVKIRKFENYARVIFASGTPDKVKALVELRRDGGHYADSGDEVIWRSEIWTFVWQYGAWVTQNRAAKVLERFRLHRSDFEKLDRLYDPQLGGISVPEGETKTVEYQLPPVLDDTMGKAAREQN